MAISVLDNYDPNENCGILNLGFDILSNIFVESQNLKLLKVSRLFYEISENVSVQIRCRLWQDSCFMDICGSFNPITRGETTKFVMYSLKEWGSHKFIFALTKNDPFNSTYSSIYEYECRINNKKVAQVLPNGSRIRKIYSNSDKSGDKSNSTLEKKEKKYIVEPLFDINDIIPRCKFKDFELFEMAVNAYKIQIDVQKEHGIPSHMLVDGKNIVSIHKPLSEYAFVRCFLKVKSINIELTKCYLENISFDYDDFNQVFKRVLVVGSLESVKILMDYGKKT
ncbi:hypothetical protein BB559_003683 [Furculomyces boomerangus]|uniref:Uncharacterized protein n=1 Tax=Furculomyces boomerangus TaxID=61424 RepID=A0A2T9YJN3_9FUNG|nr:hypothetical protein BB559_003683 [Furculomyces boomerangus]